MISIILHFFFALTTLFKSFLSKIINDKKFVLKTSSISLSCNFKKSLGLFIAETKIILSGIIFILKFFAFLILDRSNSFEFNSKILSFFNKYFIFFPISLEEPKIIVFFFNLAIFF